MGAIVSPIQGVQAGDIKYHAANAVPAGWLKANGAAISRATYAALFAAIGTTYGAGDGSTTFNIPDLRGEFLRGFDDGRGVDSGRVIGSAQLDQIQNITAGFWSVIMAFGSAPAANGAFAATDTGTSGASGSAYRAGSMDFSASRVARAGTETRARNLAMVACIKY